MIHVIIGAPCSGKSTYVKEHRDDTDIVIDFDKLAQAFGSKEAHSAPKNIKDITFAARNTAIKESCDRDFEAWIIHTSPSDQQMEMYAAAGAEFIEMTTDMETCLERCESDNRPPGTADIIKDFYERRKGALFMPERSGKMMKIKTYEVKADNGTITGYAATWIREPDSYGDVIAKGAFAESIKKIKDEGKVLPLLWNHDSNDIGAYIGTVIELEEDDHGLKFKAVFDDTPEAQRARELATSGRVVKFSFAYDILDEGKVELDDGREANELRKLNIHEVSLVMYPANPDTSIIEVKKEARVQKVNIEFSKESAEKFAKEVLKAMQKYGRRNSAKDAGDLEHIAELAEEILSIIDGMAAGEGEDPAEDAPEDEKSVKADDGLQRIADIAAEIKDVVDGLMADGQEQDEDDDDNAEEQDTANAEDQTNVDDLLKEAEKLLTKGAKE